MSMAMDRNDGGVDHGVFHIRVVRDRLKQPFKNTGPRPVVEAFEHGVPLAEILRQIRLGAPEVSTIGDAQQQLEQFKPELNWANLP